MTVHQPTGIVFDIQRCSLHDGPGIRTTVFLKGCPLHCLWCHNPESIHPVPQLAFQRDRCSLCGACAKACCQQAHIVDYTQHSFNHLRCLACGTCLTTCLTGALRMIGARMTVNEVMSEVEADRQFYQRSGGGITLSGGEPLSQFAFTRAILENCHNQGIHTCIETCGYVPRARYKSLLPLVDVILFDYKATDTQQHQTLTGVSNRLILNNLEYLLDQGAKVILRCPLVAGINDSPEHLQAIAVHSNRNPGPVSVEIMPYHNMGRDKAVQIGSTSPTSEVPTTDMITRQAWQTALTIAGCLNLTIN